MNRTLIVGAGSTARSLGEILARTGEVVLVDVNREHCDFAAASGLEVVCGSAMRADVLGEAGADRAGIFLAVTPNAEVNAVAAQHAANRFGLSEIHIPCGSDVSGHETLVEHLGATTLFGGPVSITDWDYWIEHQQTERLGFSLERLISPRQLFDELQAHRNNLPLAIRRGRHYMPFHSGSRLQARDRIILLRNRYVEPLSYDRFDRLVVRCPVIDLDMPAAVQDFFGLAAAALAADLGMSAEDLKDRFLDRETISSTVIAPGLAIPHVLIDAPGHFHILIARCRGGVSFPGHRETVHSVFMLVRSPEERNFHLRALAAIAQVVQDLDFEPRWLTAKGPEDLRKIVLETERRRYPDQEGEPN